MQDRPYKYRFKYRQIRDREKESGMKYTEILVMGIS